MEIFKALSEAKLALKLAAPMKLSRHAHRPSARSPRPVWPNFNPRFRFNGYHRTPTQNDGTIWKSGWIPASKLNTELIHNPGKVFPMYLSDGNQLTPERARDFVRHYVPSVDAWNPYQHNPWSSHSPNLHAHQ